MVRPLTVRPARCAWSLCAGSLALTALGVVLLATGHQEPGGAVGVAGAVEVLGFAGVPVVGAVIAARRPENPYGWLWCGFGMLVGVSAARGPLGDLLGWPAWLVGQLGQALYFVFVGMLALVFLLFPTGRLPGPGWRWLPRAVVVLTSVLVVAVPLTSPDPGDGEPGPWALPGEAGARLWDATGVLLVLLGSLALVAMASVLLRFRRAGPVERRQLTCFVYGALVNGALASLDLVEAFPGGLAGTLLDAVAFCLLQVAVAVAVLRYRLYEIDRIVSRTVSYAVLTAGLLVLYVLAVTALRPVLVPVTGTSEPAVAASTLAVAAAFRPARRRVQAVVDRRFDRARYDAARTVDAYARRLRSDVDLDAVTAGLRDTVAQAVGPSRMALWLRDTPHP